MNPDETGGGSADRTPRAIGRWVLRHPVTVELGLVVLAVGALSSSAVVMYVNGDKITGPVVDVRRSENNTWVTIQDPETSRRYQARFPEFSAADEFATVVVHPFDRSRVLSLEVVRTRATVACCVASLALMWPVVVWARGRYYVDLAKVSMSVLRQTLSIFSVWTAVLWLALVTQPRPPATSLVVVATAFVPTTLAVNALALHRTCRLDGYWGAAIIALDLTLSGLALWIVACLVGGST